MTHDFQPELAKAGQTNLVCIRCGKRISGAAMWMTGGPFTQTCPGALPTLEVKPLVEFDEGGWNLIKPASKDACECGAHKALGIGKRKVGHASYCPWRAP